MGTSRRRLVYNHNWLNFQLSLKTFLCHVHVRYVLPRDAHAEQQEYLVLCTVNVRCQAVAIQINEVNCNFKKRRLMNLNLKSLLNCTIDEVCPSLVMVLINIMPSKLGFGRV